MRIAVTGGSGFIGRHVIRQLRQAGHSVHNIDRDAAGGQPIDICDTADLTEAFREFGTEYVFHLAGIADAREALANPVEATRINVGGTASVLEAARQAGVKRVILASTCWVTNAMRDGVLDETEPFLPTGGGHVYTTSKIASELLTHDFQRLYHLPFTILRYGIPYGPGMWPGLVLRNFLDAAAAGMPLTIFGDGSGSRRFVYVDDLACAHVRVLQDVAVNQVYNLEGARSVPIKELAEVFAKLWGGHVEIIYKPEPTRVGEVTFFRRMVSSNKARVDLNWEPQVGLEDGVQRVIDWYRTTMMGQAQPGPENSVSSPPGKPEKVREH